MSYAKTSMFIHKILYSEATLDDQEEAFQNPYTAYYFAREVPGADIERCQEVACKNPDCAYWFVRDIPEANVQQILDKYKGTKYEAGLNRVLMEKALK